jgi:hypothetical protein
MAPMGFDPSILASERLQTYTLGRLAAWPPGTADRLHTI